MTWLRHKVIQAHQTSLSLLAVDRIEFVLERYSVVPDEFGHKVCPIVAVVVGQCCSCLEHHMAMRRVQIDGTPAGTQLAAEIEVASSLFH